MTWEIPKIPWKSHDFMSQISGSTGSTSGQILGMAPCKCKQVCVEHLQTPNPYSKTMKHLIWGVGFVLIPFYPMSGHPQTMPWKKVCFGDQRNELHKAPVFNPWRDPHQELWRYRLQRRLVDFWGRERIIGWSDWIRFDQIGWCPQNGAVIFVFVLQKQRGGGSQDDPYWFWFDWKDWSHKPLVLTTQLIDDRWGT
jgi:hypothetical protein